MKYSRSFTILLSAITVVTGQLNSPEWAAAYTKASAAVANLSLSEKVHLGTGRGFFIGDCTGNTPAIDSINFPGLCLEDGPLGVRQTSGNSAFPPGINAAATWNRTLINQRGVAMAEEFRGKGVNAQLGPMMNLMRAPASGRSWEGFGADPFLTGEAAYETIIGCQSQGVQAVAKHLMNNEQEHSRMFSSSNVDDRTEHELYLHPFLRSVQANVAAMMCSYNQINGTYACENNASINGLLKTELGFQGYVMSDWYATHSTAPSANSGLDMTMPGDFFPLSVVGWYGINLEIAVGLGEVSEDRINDMATRILAGWYLLGQDENYPTPNLNAKNPSDSVNDVNVQGDHYKIIREIGAASTVLLKNENNALPLSAPATIALIGSAAGPNPDGLNSCADQSCNKGTLGMGWGSGAAAYPYLVTPLDAITNRSATDGTNITSSLSDSDLDAARTAATGAEIAFVFITADSGEDSYTVEGNEGDRNDLLAWHDGDALVEAVASVNNNTVVVVQTVGPIIVDAWIDNTNITGLVWSGLGGQEAGNSLTDVLYGAFNPSGRLPYTIAKSADDYPASVVYVDDILVIAQIDYTEGLFIDYRHFDSAGIEPRYEFGFGLSYTTFDYSNLEISGSVGDYTPPTGAGSSLDDTLHEKVFNVTFTIQNNGSVAGNEVPQLYLSPPESANSPPYILKGFDNVYIAPGEFTNVSIPLSRYDLSIWDVVSQKWVIPSGTTGVTVGASSRDHRLTGSIEI